MTETQEQMYVFKWAAQPSIRQEYPELKYLFHVKNETKEGAAQVAIDKRMGVKKGVPDLFLPVPRGVFAGCWIEMKTAKGRTSEAQRWWIEHLRQLGYRAEVCHGWEAAATTLMEYLSDEIVSI